MIFEHPSGTRPGVHGKTLNPVSPIGNLLAINDDMPRAHHRQLDPNFRTNASGIATEDECQKPTNVPISGVLHRLKE